MVSITPFNILLNKLSGELDQRNVQSLVHVCGELIPGGQRERIASGWDVFSILLQRNAIGEEPEKMAFLLGIIKELRPKRRDLVSMVTKYIEDNYEQPEEILNDFEFSSDGYILIPRPRPSTPTSQEDCCSIRCGCFNCNCNPCCSGICCCVMVAMLLIFLAVLAALLIWYIFPIVRKNKEEYQDLKVYGPVVIGVLIFFAVCCVSFGVYINRRSRQLAYSELRSDIGDTRSINTLSESTRTSCLGSARKIDRLGKNGREYSFSSGHITASNSVNSLTSINSVRTPRTTSESTTNGCRMKDDDITQELEEEQDENDDDELIEV